jgi:cytochrome P450
MSVDQGADLYWDPYDTGLNMAPYPLFRRLRDEAPLYYNERLDFYALSRADDVERAFRDPRRLINGRTNLLDFIKTGLELPPGFFIFEDAPQHTMHRRLMSKVFSPKAVAGLEPQVRDFCGRCLDSLAGRGGFDYVKDYGDLVAARVIGMMLGIPDSDQMAVKDHVGEPIRNESGKPINADVSTFTGAMYAEYIDWRGEHPSDDLMTALLTAEFEDEHGTTRRLAREEVLTYVTLLAGAGNETTAKLIGWTGKLLSDHPDQRRELVADPSLIPAAIEEILRYESPGMQCARYAVADVEFPGGTVPAGSAVVAIMGSANHDDRRFPDAERFDIHRKPSGILTFAVGAHFCLGAALARLQGRVALEEVLKRFPEWSVDEARAVLRPTSTTRGYGALPVLA